MRRAHLIVPLLAALTCTAHAEVPAFTPYRPLYPALYLDAAWQQDDGDEVFDASGKRRSTVLPSTAGRSRFPEQALDGRLAWYFPMFEQDALPFFSSRLHTARVSFRYADLASRGAIADFIDADASLQHAGGGLGDTVLEFGSFLSGSAGWREGRTGPLSSLLLLGVNLPTGVYDRNAAVNAGSNHFSVHLKLGAHAAIWRGAFLDGALGYRVHGRNQEPQFGALAPSQAGDDAIWDLQLAQRLRPGLYLALSASGSEGARNRYRDPRLSLREPEAAPLGDVIPVPGTYHDDGTDLRLLSIALRWFLHPRVAAALHYTHPLSGHSGEFELDQVQRTPAGCNVDAPGCVVTPAGSTRVDGLGSARSDASDRIGLSFTWQFGQGDTWGCPGCSD